MISAGSLKDYITILAPSDVPDSSGQRNVNFVTLRQCWAEVVPLSGAELMESRMVYSKVTTRVRCRYNDGKDVNAGMRIQIGDSRFLNIMTVIDVGRGHQMIEMRCEEPS